MAEPSDLAAAAPRSTWRAGGKVGDGCTPPQLDSMANVQLLSGANATGARTALNGLSMFNATSTSGRIALDLGKVPDKIGSLTVGSTWRLGGGW